MLQITINKRQMQALKAELTDMPKEIPHILRRAINKVAVTARKKVIDTIAREIAVKKSDLRNRNVKLTRASFQRLMAIIHVMGRRIPLLKFGARQLKTGVSYRIGRREGRKKIAHAFIAAMASGHQGVFIRRSAGRSLNRRQRARIAKLGGYGLMGSEGRRGRLPIVEQFGPSVPEVVDNLSELTQAAMDQAIGGQLQREIDSQVSWVLSKRKGVA